jgi:beta-glucosidase
MVHSKIIKKPKAKSKILFNTSLSSLIIASFVFSPLGLYAKENDTGIKDWPKITSPFKQDAKQEEKIKEMLASMTLRQKIGQMVQADIRYITPQQVRENYIGSVLNGGGAWPNMNKYSTPQDWVNLADEYYNASMTSDMKHQVPMIWGIDAVHGNNNIFGSVAFPHNIGLGAAHNPKLIGEIAKSTAIAVRATGIDWAFAPTLAVVQNQRWGRSYESYSNDPKLVKQYAYEFVKSLQGDLTNDGNVLASAKHFLGDGGTKNGVNEGKNFATENELINKHGLGYYGALAAGSQTVMVTYSEWNQDKTGEINGKIHGNKYLLTDVLKNKMGFDGLLVSDWNGIGQVANCTNSHCPQAINAGIDMIMVPEDWKAFIENTHADVMAGTIPQSRIDDAVTRILRVKMRLGVWDKKPSQNKYAGKLNLEADKELARRAVRQSVVLLKNNNNVLPLAPNKKILVVGTSADNISNQTGGWTLTWQGDENKNSDFPNATSLLTAIKKEIGEKNVDFSIDGKNIDPKKYAAIIAVVGETPYAETKGDLRLPKALSYSANYKDDAQIINALKGKGTPIISVLYSGRTIYTNDLINSSDAFISAFLPGTEAQGLSDLMFKSKDGKIKYDFSARLSFPWPSNACPPATNEAQGNYRPLYQTGYGLNYKSKSKQGQHKVDLRETCPQN